MSFVRHVELGIVRYCIPPKTLRVKPLKRPLFPTLSYSGKEVLSEGSYLSIITRGAHSICSNSNQIGNHASLQVSKKSRSTLAMSVTRSIDPLVWVDCEMTGLDPENDTILSISCYITDHQLNLIEPKGYHAVIATPPSVLSSMGEWCIKTHTATGLVDACQSPSAIPASQAATEILEYIRSYIPKPRVALLAGNSVHADKMFLMQNPWTPVLGWLHYRILDVSAIKEAVRRWGSQDVLDGIPKKKLTHSADEDIKESLEEAKYYMQLIQKLGHS